MNQFLSEENINLHREYIRQKRLKYSIIESSVRGLRGAEISDIYRIKMSDRDRADSIELLTEIKLHDVYFTSFSPTRYQRSERVAHAYGNEAAFLNELYRLCLSLRYGFVCVYLLGGRIFARGFDDYESAFRFGDPLLAIDVCEHVYFMDFGFDRERYLFSSLPYLDIAKLSAPID